MAQTAKFIDITRTFLPVDPNSFPETLHVGGRDEAPENRVPVMAYKGYNFLPTSYGYKSYFGTAQSVGIDALVARVDAIFIYQNQGYENILIALTETGVWTKKGEAVGAWVNVIPFTAPTDPKVHYMWTSCIIANVLYAYQQGRPSYQKFVHNSITQLTITSVVPSFLNMPAQTGIFKAAGRLAFWDSADSVGWANLDDFADFTPSLETLAGNSVFTDIQGRIVTILPHGPGFIIYSTKSIVYIAQNTNDVFQWKPTVILSTAGIAYQDQVVAASPDTLHFAYTPEGLKKVEMAKEETIVPEVTDFLQDYASPIYLKILGGRYLFLEILDQEYITGDIQLSDEVVPAVEYHFPGSTETLDGVTPGGDGMDICPIMNGIDKGFTDAYPTPLPVDKKAGTFMTPVYTCYLSKNGVTDAENIVWTAAPCPTVDPNGVEVNMNPGGLTVGKMTQDKINKVATAGAQAYVDGKWTMERFFQAQTAIWEAEARAIKDFISAATGRAKSVTKTTSVSSCAVAPVTRAECTLGRLVTDFSGPKFGYSKCSFWLTRYATAAIDLIRVKSNTTTCTPIPEQYSLWRATTDWGTMNLGFVFTSPLDAAAAAQLAYENAWSEPHPGTSRGVYTVGAVVTTSPGGQPLSYRILDKNGAETTQAIRTVTVAASFTKTESMNAYNKGIDVADFGIGAIESAFCQITGWKYTKTDGTEGTVAVGTDCVAPTIYPANTAGLMPGGGKMPISGTDGSICGIPYIAPVIGGSTIIWPPTVVTLPPSSFLLQLGSNAPMYPTFEGALVYDLQLKKWGKMKARYKQLLDYSPINTTRNGVVPSNVFGIMAGTLLANGKITLFDKYPTDSYISYGKIGYNRLGETRPQETIVHFKAASTGTLKIETSLEGKNLSAGFTKEENFKDALKTTLYGGYPGRWCNIEIRGIYDINYLEFRGFIQGRR